MKKTQIVSKSVAKAVKNQNPTASAMPYDRGKYKPESVFVGMLIDVSDHILVVWEERRQDRWGKFKVLRCLVAR
jgi:hypothetical protein